MSTNMINTTEMYFLLACSELRKEQEYETDENIPSCWLALCLDWFLQKICCGSNEVLGSQEEVNRNNGPQKF